MIPGDCPQSNNAKTKPPYSSNGTHAHTDTINTDESQDSKAYRTMKEGLDAWEMWEELDTPGKLQVILTHYSATQ